MIIGEKSILSRPESFVRGVALSSDYNPSWQPFINNGFQNISEDHANWVVLTPTWTVDDLFHPVIEPIPARILWFLTNIRWQIGPKSTSCI